MKQTVKSLTAMLIINRFRAVLACEFRTTTQQTLKFVNIPTTIKILQKIDKIIISIYTISVNFGLWPLRLVLDCLKFYIYRKHQNHIFFHMFQDKNHVWDRKSNQYVFPILLNIGSVTDQEKDESNFQKQGSTFEEFPLYKVVI